MMLKTYDETVNDTKTYNQDSLFKLSFIFLSIKYNSSNSK